VRFVVLSGYAPADLEALERDELFEVAARVVLDAGGEVVGVTPGSYVIVDVARKRYVQRETLGRLLGAAVGSEVAMAIVDSVASLGSLEERVRVLADPGAPSALYSSDVVFSGVGGLVSHVASLAPPLSPCECAGAGDEIGILALRVPDLVLDSLRVLDPRVEAGLCADGRPAVRVMGECLALPAAWSRLP